MHVLEPSPLEKALVYYNTDFVSDFRRALCELAETKDADRLWMMGPTAYLFSLSGMRFAVDLQIRREQDRELLLPHIVSDTAPLSFILITHSHDDHMCIPLMQSLREMPIRWYIPADCRADLLRASGLSEDRIVPVHDGNVFREGSLTIRAFYSPHVKADEPPFPQCGYEIVDSSGHRILMPADVRDYTYQGYPDLGSIDLCFAHLWGGSNAMGPSSFEPVLSDFAAFQARFRAKQYAFCHLYEIGRPEQSMWHDGHAALAGELLSALLPACRITVPRVGCAYAPNSEYVWEEIT